MEDKDTSVLEGVFRKVIYRSANYMVALFKTDDQTLTVTGPSFDFEEEQRYEITGSFVEHPRYGIQFSLMSIQKHVPSEKEEIIAFLRSKTFPGVGKRAAEKVYDHFGDETIDILKKEPERILELALSDRQLLSLQKGFENLSDPQNETLFYLVSNGFNNNEAQRIFNRFKLATIEVGNDNPFRFYSEVYGIPYTKVREFASKVEFSDPEEKMLEAYLVYTLNDYTFRSGDMYITYDDLVQLLSRKGDHFDLDGTLERCCDKQYLACEDDRIYLFNDLQDEKFISRFLSSFNGDLYLDASDIDTGIKQAQETFSIRYDAKQVDAIRQFFLNDITMITGGPGTGKTTIVKTMVEMFKRYLPYNNLVVVAPTGRAAKRINEICDCESKTIHSLLKWNKDTNTFIFNIDNPLMYDALIIDEFSMVDNALFASLLKACGRVKKICIIGDSNQLPSIKPGDLLADMLESGCFVHTALEYNYRQSEGSEIIDLSNSIIRNDVDLDRYHQDISFYDINQRGYDIVSLIENDMEEGYEIDEIQVLTPMHKGLWGIENLNLQIQEAFNPPSPDKKEKRAGKYVFRENDKILQLKNRPLDDVYNGDIGFLEDIDELEKSLMVNYSGVYVFYPFEDLEDISLAYAMSVHKAQGSEYQVVYFIISKSNIGMLDRKLIYTAISRAKNKLVIIGTKELFYQGLKRLSRKRKTGLKEKLEYEQR